MLSKKGAAAVAVLFSLLMGFSGYGLEGPALYVYAESSVYSPGSTAEVRVLAVDVDGNPASGLQVLASVYGPENTLLPQVEAETDSSGWAVFTVFLEREGVYYVFVEAVDPAFTPAETFILVCSTCPTRAEATTVTTTATTTVAGPTITSLVRETVTTTQGATVVLTTSEFLTRTVVETRLATTTVVSRLVSTATSVYTFVVGNGFATRTVTVVSTMEITNVETRTVVVSTSGGFWIPLLIVVVVLFVSAFVVFYAFRSGARGF